MTDYFHYKSGNGTVFNVPYEASFVVENRRHVHYFAVCYLDVNSMIADGFLKKIPRNFTRYRSQMTSESYMRDGRKTFNKQAFMHPNGRIWTGAVHFHPGVGYMEGSRHTDMPHATLTKTTVGNVKMHDYTIFKDLENLMKMPNTPPRKTRPYFSRAYMSRDKNNACRFIFGFDYLSALRDNVKFGGLVDSMPDTFKSARIKLMKVTRKRAHEENYSSARGVIESEEIICYSADRRATGVLQRAYNRTDLDGDGRLDSYIGSIGEVNLKNADRVRNFMVFDNSMSTLDDGKYQYSAEILLEDPTEKILLNKLRQIRAIKKDMLVYYNLACRPGNFVHESNRFSPVFVSRYKKRENISSDSLGSVRGAVWNKSIYNFLNIFDTLTNRRTLQRYYKPVGHMVRPSTGTTQGIKQFIKLIEFTESYLCETLLGEFSEEFFENRKNLKKGHGSARRGLIRIEYTFKEQFNASIMKNLGYDYWGSKINSPPSGLGFLTKNSFTRRIEENRASSRITQYNSLKPAQVRYSAGRVDLSDRKKAGKNEQMINFILSQIKEGKFADSSPLYNAVKSKSGWSVSTQGRLLRPKESLSDRPANFEISNLSTRRHYKTFEDRTLNMQSSTTPSRQNMADKDKFHQEGLTTINKYDVSDKRYDSTEQEAIMDLEDSLLKEEDKNYLGNLQVNIQYFNGYGASGLSEDSWEPINESIISGIDSGGPALLVRLVGREGAVETDQLDSGKMGAYDEIILVTGNTDEGGETELQSQNYGSEYLGYDTDGDLMRSRDEQIINENQAEETMYEDENALDMTLADMSVEQQRRSAGTTNMQGGGGSGGGY